MSAAYEGAVVNVPLRSFRKLSINGDNFDNPHVEDYDSRGCLSGSELRSHKWVVNVTDSIARGEESMVSLL